MKKKIFGFIGVVALVGGLFFAVNNAKADVPVRKVKYGHVTWNGNGCAWPGSACVRKIVIIY